MLQICKYIEKGVGAFVRAGRLVGKCVLAEGNDKRRGNIKNGKNSGQSNKTKTKNKQQKLLRE